MKNWIMQLDEVTFGTGTFSQSYQDQLLRIIYSHIEPVNEKPYAVEFGFSSSTFEEGTGANVATLVLENGWDCLLLDGGHENPEINLYKHFLTSKNIISIFQKYQVPLEPEYVSIDLDSTDLWVFKELLENYRAQVFSVEYNSNFPLSAAITFANNSQEFWENDRGYGASLKALTIVAEQAGYSLLWVVPYLDAFFIRNDLIDDGSGILCFPFEKWKYTTGIVCHPPLKHTRKSRIFLDYEVYIESGGDTHKSRIAAQRVCKQYLEATYYEVVIRTLKKMIPKGIKNLIKKDTTIP